MSFVDGLIRFHLGLWHSPWPVKVWLVALAGSNMAAALFLPRIEAIVTLLALGASLLLMSVLTARSGFTRLLGLGHILWLGLIPWLWHRGTVGSSPELFLLWLQAVIVLNTISVVIDVVDVMRYVRGERDETVQLAP